VGRGGDVDYGAVQYDRAVWLRGMVSPKEMSPAVTEFISAFMVDDSVPM
jgi:hypothetical protein